MTPPLEEKTEKSSGLDNVNAIANIIETGEVEEAQMILGDREKIRYSGIIRAGVKIPKNSCSTADKELFKKLEAEGLPYDEIDRKIGGEPKSAKSKLFPTNCDHFVIRPCDFKREADADYILDNFADPDGHVRRIPIWLTMADIKSAIPHNFRAFDGSGSVRAVSDYQDGQLVLRYIPTGIKGPAKKEDWKTAPFNPDKPPADAPKGIQFGGLYKVNIPGLRGLGEIVVPTRSFYGMGDAVGQLKRVRSLLGRFNGLLNGQPFLELCKVAEIVKTPDGKKQKQYIITIELSIDPMELARHAEKLMERGPAAIAMFNGHKPSAPPPVLPTESAPPVEPIKSQDPPTAPTSTNSAPDSTGSGQSPASSVRRNKVLAYIGTLPEILHPITLAELMLFISYCNSGQTVEELSDDDLAKTATSIKDSIKGNKELFQRDLIVAIGG